MVSVRVCVCVRYAVNRLTTFALFVKIWVNTERSSDKGVKQLGSLHI